MQNGVNVDFFNKVDDIYDIGERMGCTDYIDFLDQDEVPKNLMKGIDMYRRPFLTVKIGGIDLETNKFFRSGQVFFQRYTDSLTIAGACFRGNKFKSSDSFINTCGGTRPEQYQLINDLVDGKLIKIKEEHKFNSSKYNVIIASMDYWENKFARTIQKNWFISRYNPRFTICKKILNQQYDEYEVNVN